MSAVDLAHYYGGAGAVAGGLAGVGAGAEADVMTRKTEAYIDQSEAVRAKEAVTVKATAERKIISIVANATGGAGAFTGSAGLGLIKGETRAYLQGSKVETKDLNVTANYKGDFFLAIGAAAVGGAGFSSSLSAALDLSLTEAFVSGSQVMASGKTTVTADTDLVLQHWVVSSAIGLAGGIAGNALVDLAATTTKAYILNSDLGAADQRNGSLAVNARDKIELINRAGALGLTLGNVGIGASANVNAISNTVLAFINHSTIYTTDQQEVTASTERKVDAIGASAGMGLAAGLGGNASLILIGSIFNDANSDIKNELNANGQGTLAEINKLMTGNRLRTGETDGNIRAGDEGEYGVSGVSQAEITRVNQASNVDVIGFLNTVGQSGVSALVQDSTLDAGNDVSITAHSGDQIRINAGAGGIGAVSAGGTAGVVLMKNNLRAEVTGASSVTATGNLVIDARSLNSNGGAPAVQVYSFQGSAGVATLGAAVALADVTNNLTARVGRGTTLNLLNAEGAVMITAVDETNISTKAEGLSVGGATAGLVAAVAKRGGRIEASVAQGGTPGAGTTLMSKGNLILHSSLAGKINAYSQAGTGGAGTVQGTVAEATEESAVTALLGEKLTLEVENASILAEAKPDVKAEAYGYNGGLVASVGTVVANATAKPLVTASIGRNNMIKATDFALTAANLGSALEAIAVAGGGSLGVAANATESKALHQSKVMTLVDASTFMISGQMIDDEMTGGNMNVKALNNMGQKATAGGVTLGGLVAAGGNVAQVKSETETHVKLANGIKGTITGHLAVDATGTDQLSAEAISGSGGIFTGHAAVAGVSKNNRTWVDLGGGGGNDYLTANIITAHAKQETTFNSKVDSTNAAVAGKSGAQAGNTVNSRVEVLIAENARFRTTELFSAQAKSMINKPWLPGDDFNVKVGSGGVIDGSAGASNTALISLAKVIQGKNSRIDSIGIESGDLEEDYGQSKIIGGTVNYNAVNEIVAYDNVRLDTGGAIGIAKTESKITADQVNSEIILDENAVLKAITANLGAQTKASIETSANSKTYGAAGAAAGASLSRLNTVNLVEIGKKALVEAEEINLGAGRDIDGMTNNVQIMAFTDLYNNTAFPVKTDPEAVADAYQNNRIRIADGAKLLGIRDVNLLTTEGYQSVYGRGTGMDLYRAAGEKIANAFRELFGKEKISLKITAGESLYGRNILVYVDGTVQTGVHSKEGLVFDLDGNLVARTERMNYVIDGDYIDVQDTRVVAGGNITINALKLYGKGNLLASGDAEITITNHSRYHLRVNNLIIDGAERGGHLYFNGIAVNSADEIKRINLDQFGLGGVVDLTVVAPGSAVVPRITINNTYTPITGDGPNLDIIGLVSNLSGAINIANAKGNINVAGRILAETVNMSSGKDIFLDYIDGFRHVPSDPMALWDETIKELRAITDELTEFDGTKDPLDLTYYYFCSFMDPKQGSGALIAGNHLYISAEYVNINGTIQSGIPNWNLELDMNGGLYRWLEGKWLGFSVYKSGPLGDYIDHLQRKWEEEGRPALDEHALQHYRLTEHDNKKGGIASYYNPETKEIVVEDVKVEGGKAVIEGKIINTGGGQIKVMDGFGRINIVNNTPYALKLNRLDTGNIEGTLTITDPNITYNGSPLTKVYRRLGNDIIIDTLVQWGDDAKSYSEVLPNSRNANYQPLANQRYYVETLKHGERRRETASWWYGWEGFVEDHPYDWAQKEKDYRYMVTWIREDEETPEFYVLSEEILVTETKYQNKRWVGIENHPGAYYFQFHNGPQSGPYSSDWRAIFDGAQYPDEIGMYLASWVFPDFEERISHSFKADYTIGVEFIGADSGQLSITSGGPVRFSGLASNLKGGITVEAEGGIEQASGKAVLKADQLNLVAKTGQIGSRENPLAVQVTAADGLTALAKNIYIRGVAGDLVLTEVKTDFIDLLLGGGEIRLEAVGNIYGTGNSWVLDGNRIELVSEQGSIGNGPESPLRIKSGDKGLRAAAAYDIYLSQAEGDVYLESVVSTLGDVWLQALNGSFFDANYSERRDLRTEEELLRHWENMRLLGEGAEASAAETIAAYENAKKYEYETYWRFRNIRPVYDEQGQLVDYVADPYKPETASPELQELHILYGETTFDPNWEYKVSAEERAELTEGYLWTREQLETSLNKLVLSKQTTSTVPVFEDPNIRGRNVTLLAEKGSIGSDRGQLVIDANNPVALQDRENRLALAAAEASDVLVDDENLIITVLLRDSVDIDLLPEGSLEVVARDFVYLGSQEPLYVKAVQSGGDIRIKGKDGLYSVTGTDLGAVQGNNLIIEGDQGGIGTAENPFRIDLPELGTLIARAEKGIYIREMTGNLNVAEIYGRNEIGLWADGSILDAGGPWRDYVIEGKSISLVTAKGDIGRPDADFRIFSPQGEFSASAHRIYLANNSSLVNLGAITADGELRVKTLGDLVITDLIDVQGAGGVRLEANGSIEQSDSGRIHTSFLETASSKGQLLTGENRISVLKAVNGNGDLSFTNMTDLVVEALQNGEGQINLLVLAGGLKVTRLQAAGGLLTIKADRLELEKLVHDGASGLFLDVTGSSREMAEDVLIKGTSPTGLHFTRLTTDFGVIQGETERLGFDHLRIGTYAEIENSLNNVIIDNLNRKYYETDLQLSVPTKAFYLMLNPGSEIKTNGFIIRYNAARISNDLGKTVLETTGDMQVQASLSTPKPGESDAVQKTPETDYLITGIENVLGGQETEVEQDADEEEEAEEEETGEEEEAEAQDVDEEGEAEGQSAEVKEEAEAQDADEEEEAEAQETDEEGEAEEQDTEEEVEAEEQNAEVEHEAKVQE